MLIDLIIGIAASLIASLIVGFLGNKAVTKSNNVILKLYICFLSIIVFICCSLVSIVLNKEFGERIASISEVSLVYFYDSCIYAFMFVIGAVVLVTLFVVYAIATVPSALTVLRVLSVGDIIIYFDKCSNKFLP